MRAQVVVLAGAVMLVSGASWAESPHAEERQSRPAERSQLGAELDLHVIPRPLPLVTVRAELNDRFLISLIASPEMDERRRWGCGF
jgi:hypothetical protein